MNESNQHSLILNILEYARWAPSGDNMQTWRFEIKDANHLVIHGYDTREHCAYDLQGHASQLAIGVLMESINIAASHFQHRAQFILREGEPENKIVIDVWINKDESMQVDPLFTYLPKRSVQRRPFKTTELTNEQVLLLKESIGITYRIKWIKGWKGRLQAAKLMFKNGKLRLTLPEAYATHSTIIEWNAQFSNDKIPDKAIGLDPMALILMKWALKSWDRVKFLNTYMAGTLIPRIELDLIPGICCAAHFCLVAKKKPTSKQEHLDAGRAIQRFWLTATQLGLQIQPEMTPLIFYRYLEHNVEFTKNQSVQQYARKISNQFKHLFDSESVNNMVFLGRIGVGEAAKSRSMRMSVNELLMSSEKKDEK